MFTIYHSNQLDIQKDILVELMQRHPLKNPLQPEIVLVQSPGMAQWLQQQIASQKGIAANFTFPMPASFVWQLYVENLSDVKQQTEFNKNAILWRLLRIIPDFIERPTFQPLKHYLSSFAEKEQFNLFLLAEKIADLFDQYLVYRPDWILAWERFDDAFILRQIQSQQKEGMALQSSIEQNITWQGELWRALNAQIQQEYEQPIAHRATLHKRFLEKISKNRPHFLPERLFIFGISALPQAYLDIFNAISPYCDVHLFFNNASQEYWGDIIDPIYAQKLALRHRQDYQTQQTHPWLSAHQLTALQQAQWEQTYTQEILQVGNALLASWGKLGRDFSYALTQLDANEITAYAEPENMHLLGQIQKCMLYLMPNKPNNLQLAPNDHSLTFHSCHTMMREVEVLQDYLLHLFQEHPDLTPKDIVVMAADIDQYTPYIQAVFGQQQGSRYIPFSISDNKLSESEVLVAAFLALLDWKAESFSAEKVLVLLDIPAIRDRFGIELRDLPQIRHWVEQAGVRFGLQKNSEEGKNYNAWQAGLQRMLLGYAMREENGIWQDSLGLDDSIGLSGQLVGNLCEFLTALEDWYHLNQQSHTIEHWQNHLLALCERFFLPNAHQQAAFLVVKETIQQLADQIAQTGFDAPICIEIIAQSMAARLSENPANYHFLSGKVNFCTLLPMRAIPFKVICLLGMNEGDYPRMHHPNSFDLMQYHHQKGDRARRDDDRYLFLEALLSAQDFLYISYIGRSISDNQVLQPSVLVSELWDYLTANLAENIDWRSTLCEQHAMTPWSSENFSKKNRSFATQWLPLVNRKADASPDFIQPIPEEEQNAEKSQDIEFTKLVQFVCDPIKFFFKHQLGVYFDEQDEPIAESENFSLPKGLTAYQLRNQLLPVNEQDYEQFFDKLTIKGVLPREAFGEIEQFALQSEVQAFKQKITDYLESEQGSHFQLSIQTARGEMRLLGTWQHLQSSPVRIVNWRCAKTKDRDVIETWLWHLLHCVLNDSPQPSIFIGVDKNWQFVTLAKEQALKQLSVYADAFLQSKESMQFVPTAEDYWKQAKETAVDFEKNFAELERLAQGGKHQRQDLYLQRVLQQSPSLDLMQVNQQVRDWFGLMYDCRQEL